LAHAARDALALGRLFQGFDLLLCHFDDAGREAGQFGDVDAEALVRRALLDVVEQHQLVIRRLRRDVQILDCRPHGKR
jgi:hypothetical protein